MNTFTSLTVTVLLFISFSVSSNAEVKTEESIPDDQGEEIICAEQCSVDRDIARRECRIIYDDGLCFGNLPCLDDTEVALRQCENIADTIHFGCASRCYKTLLEKTVDD